jgi:hypothetical protein
MKRSPIVLGFVAITALFGCASSSVEEEGVVATESAAATNCELVLCAAVVCEPGSVAKTNPGQCCPICVPDHSLHKGDCVCSGGYMDASYCSQFGDPWTTTGTSCVWPSKGNTGLTAEQCAGVGAKHGGDGSGSDIYNLGVSCTLVGDTAADCRVKGCPTNQHCDVCKTTSGAAYVCLPDGATC